MSAEQEKEKQMATMTMRSGNRQMADPLDNYFARRRSQALDINANNPRNTAQWYASPLIVPLMVPPTVLSLCFFRGSLSPASPDDTKPFVSLKDVMAAEELTTRAVSLSEPKPKPTPTTPPTPSVKTRKTSWTIPSVQHTAVDLAAIQKAEQGREVERRRQISKPLEAIQLEERAMQELLWAYGARAHCDELITVERAIDAELALPVWRAHQ
jgi:hypothetical protein